MRRRIPLPERGGAFLGRDYFKHDLVNLRKPGRITHLHMVGASNRGKSNLVEVVVRQDILQLDGEPRGVTLIDPHGSTYQSLVEWIAANRINKHRTIRLIDPSATDFAFSFNPFRALSHFDLASLVDLLVNATIQIWGAQAITQSPQVAEVLAELYTAIGALGLTLADSNDFLLRECEKVRRHHLERLEDINHEAWMWWEDLERLSSTRRDEYLAPVRRRLRLFLGSVFVKRIFSQRSRALDLAAEIDRGSILLINLKPGPTLSADAARLLGALLVNEFYTSIFRRNPKGLQHYLYLDECQLFLTPDIARILDQARKFKLSMVLSHQHLGHLREAGEGIYRSVMTNCNCKVVFGGLDPDDAETMSRIMFRGSFDLQRGKRKMIRPIVVGQEKLWARARERHSEPEPLRGEHLVGRQCNDRKYIDHQAAIADLHGDEHALVLRRPEHELEHRDDRHLLGRGEQFARDNNGRAGDRALSRARPGDLLKHR
jgi:type IV secretory system conjugative DNA transfer VirD4/TraG family protein